jgi:glutathione S-transferase
LVLGSSAWGWALSSAWLTISTLGVPYKLVGRTYSEIRGSFETETGNAKVTVPTIETPEGFVTDSWKIAEWVSNRIPRVVRSAAAGWKGSS